ncbi:MAG: TolC family protein [Rhodothermaceae bacterium]
MRNKIINKTVLLLLAAVLTSCLTVKDYKSPEIKNSDIFRTEVTAADIKPEKQLQWRKFFSDPILINYIDSALVNNFDNKIAFENIKKAEAYLEQGKLNVLPSLALNANVQRTETKKSDSEQYKLSGDFDWEIDLWGKLTSQKNASEASFLKSVVTQKYMQTNIISGVAKTYYQLLVADEELRIMEETLLIKEKNLYYLHQLKEAGMIDQIQINRITAQVDETKTRLNQTKKRVLALENALVLLLGKPYKNLERGRIADQNMTELNTKNITAKYLSNRPDLKEAELDLRYFFEQNNVAYASLYPSIRLSASLGFSSLDISDWFDSESSFLTLIGGITQPIFARGELEARLKASESDLHQSIFRFRKKMLEAGMEVSNTIKDYETNSENLILSESQEKQFEEALSNTEELFRAGNLNYIEVLAAQETLLNVKLARISTQSARLQSAATLYRALGGGVE